MMKKCALVVIIALCVCPLLFSQASGSTRYVAVQTAVLKDSTGFFAKETGKLSLGDVVTLVRQDGKWSQVRAGNITGWIASTSLSARQVVASVSSVTASEVALAGKGFSPETELEYRKNGLDYSMVDIMEQTVITIDELLRFINEGRLARGE